MPTVKTPKGKTKHFAYTSEGKRAAKEYAEKVGGMMGASMKKMSSEPKKPEKPAKKSSKKKK